MIWCEFGLLIGGYDERVNTQNNKRCMQEVNWLCVGIVPSVLMCVVMSRRWSATDSIWLWLVAECLNFFDSEVSNAGNFKNLFLTSL